MQGMMRGGALFQLPPLGHTTRAGAGSVSRGSGRRLMWPTPRAMPEGRSFNSQFLNLTMAAQSPKYAEWGVGTLAKQTNGAMNPLSLEVKKLMQFDFAFTVSKDSGSCIDTPDVRVL